MAERRTWKTVVISILVTALFGVLSVLYADIRSDIDSKANKEVVEKMYDDIKYIRQGVDELRKAGYND